MAMLKQVCCNNKIRLTDILGNQIAKHRLQDICFTLIGMMVWYIVGKHLCSKFELTRGKHNNIIIV